MKPTVIFLLVAACKPVLLDKPGSVPTELTRTKHVKPRSQEDNRKQVEYFNSLQHSKNKVRTK
jgi:hypothetical protein